MSKPKNKDNQYFNHIHDEAIDAYIHCDDPKIRNKIYIETIEPVFTELIQKIVYRFKFTNLPNIDSLIEECHTHLVTVIPNFKKEKGFKPFSFFSIITKNWFSFRSKKNALKHKQETECAEISKSIETEFLSTENSYFKDRNQKEFLKALKEQLLVWQNLELKPNEIKVLHAINVLLSEIDSIEIFNKKAIFLYCRELTGLNTKQILSGLQKFRELYKVFKKDWNNTI